MCPEVAMAESDSSPPLRILITEDHADTARVMKMLLERYGMIVQTTGTIAEALDLARQEKFDVLIGDMRLPDGDGFMLNRAVRQTQNLKSICLSGDPVTSDDEHDPAAGFTAYLTKPVDLPKLLETIREITSS
jgi:CheY-like chemotaxis protein